MLVVGALLSFDVRQGPRPIAIVVPAIVSGLGVSLVGIFQGSNTGVANGLIAFHEFGAQAVMPAGNLMAIVVGANGAAIGLGRGRRTASIVLGIVGLAAFPVFMADVLTGWAWNIGMFERAVIYPIMIGHVLLGSGLTASRQTPRRRPVAAGRSPSAGSPGQTGAGAGSPVTSPLSSRFP